MSEKIIVPLVGLIAFCTISLAVIVILVIVESKKKSKDKFDERQLLARNAAYKYAFFTLLFYSIVCGGLSAGEVKWAESGAQMFIGVHLSFFIFCALCILLDAFFLPKSRTMNSFLFCSFWFSIVAVINIIRIFSSGEGFISDSGLNFNVVHFCYGIMYSGLCIVTVIKKIINNRQAVEDE